MNRAAVIDELKKALRVAAYAAALALAAYFGVKLPEPKVDVTVPEGAKVEAVGATVTVHAKDAVGQSKP